MFSVAIVVLLVIIIMVLIYCLIEATKCSAALTVDSSKDANISIAYSYITWTVGVLWTVIILIIIGIIVLFIYGTALIPSLGKTIFYAIFGILAIAVIVIAVMASLTAYYIGASAKKDQFQGAYSSAIQAAVIPFAVILVLVLGYVAVWKSNKKSEEIITPVLKENGNTATVKSASKEL